MKIWVKEKTYEEVLALPRAVHKKPMKQYKAIRMLLKLVSAFELAVTGFSYEKVGMERLQKKEPCLVLMNHSSFIDLEVAAYLLSNREYHIVTTMDAFIGKRLLMRLLGCISTRKFVSDMNLIKDMRYTLKELKASVLMYPEAGYSFDGTKTTLPESLGKCVKLFKVPVVMICTDGAYLRNPLYNELRRRRVKIFAKMEYLLSPEEIEQKSVEEINAIIDQAFSFDAYKSQQKKQLRIRESYRATGLHRVLYKCPHCLTEGQTEGKGIRLICHQCKAEYKLTDYGYLEGIHTEAKFTHIPDWYRWERECVRNEMEQEEYEMNLAVDIYVLADTKCIYKVGEGQLHHNKEGFHLTGCNGTLEYRQSAKSSYSLNSDFYWYSIGDVIGIGDEKISYYCFPKNGENIVTKARFATEELYKMYKGNYRGA